MNKLCNYWKSIFNIKLTSGYVLLSHVMSCQCQLTPFMSTSFHYSMQNFSLDALSSAMFQSAADICCRCQIKPVYVNELCAKIIIRVNNFLQEFILAKSHSYHLLLWHGFGDQIIVIEQHPIAQECTTSSFQDQSKLVSSKVGFGTVWYTEYGGVEQHSLFSSIFPLCSVLAHSHTLVSYDESSVVTSSNV